MNDASSTPVTGDDAIQQAARLLESGALVAFPTETVYGLGADAENPEAVARIYSAKGRPSGHPVIVHVASAQAAQRWAVSLPDAAHALMAAFWPGPLTLIVRRAPTIPDAVSGGQDTIGLRCPSHPVAQALLRAFKGGQGGVAAPSANRFGRVSPTTADHVREEFGTGPDSPVACILDGGQSAVGIESTIVDVSRLDSHGPVLLRPGSISVDAMEEVLGVRPRAPDEEAPRVSGSLTSHYAPRTPVVLVPTEGFDPLLQQLHQRRVRIAAMVWSEAQREAASAVSQAVLSLPGDPAGYAHGLYAALRTLDTAGVDLIVVQAPPDRAEWSGIRDRLQRAAHDSTGVVQRLLA